MEEKTGKRLKVETNRLDQKSNYNLSFILLKVTLAMNHIFLSCYSCCHVGILAFAGSTGKSLSEALIFASTIENFLVLYASTNPQYDDRLFIELQVQYMNSKLTPGENMMCKEIVSDIQNNFCTQHVLPMFCKKKSF